MENTLISSTLMILSPAERKLARHATYPIFKDNSNSRDMIEYSYLFDEIPFALKPITDHWRKDLCGRYEVFYHDEKIDWGIGSDGWEVPSTRQNHREGMLLIGTSDTSSRVLEGYLLFIPNEDDEISDDEIIEEEEDDDDGGDDVIDEDDDDDEESHTQTGMGRSTQKVKKIQQAMLMLVMQQKTIQTTTAVKKVMMSKGLNIVKAIVS